MAEEWDQYKDRYRQRPGTYDAYVEVWTHHPQARAQFSGWAIFSQCANAEPQKVAEMPDRVRSAEEIMERAGYVVGTPTAQGARQWWRSPAV